MIKIIGFTNKVNGYQTTKGKMNNIIFQKACEKLAERTGASVETYLTKRQADKFFRGHGIVYNEVVNN